MDQPRRKPFAGFLSRSGTDKSAFQRGPGLSRSDTASSALSISLSSLDVSDDEKGQLGLTTLYEPQAPTNTVAEIVFIHGLGGGSRKTWSYSSEPHHYWPRYWLPADNDFTDVRIHTFGYKADWGERRQSVLDINDFAQSLLGALRNDPGIRRTDTRIVLVGHSMGGCVAKKAYILARQDPTAADLAGRIQSMFFLGTPHRGSDMAGILENMLAVTWGRKPFVTDLTPNSAALESINNTFRHFAPELRLWSFHETLPIRGAGVMSRIVVERHSATLGYHNEEIAAMDADHRQVCKFDTPADPNYKMLRNALLTAVDLIRETARTGSSPLIPVGNEANRLGMPSEPPMSLSEASSLLRSFLGVRDSLDGDLATLQVLKQPGSCQWFTKKPCFVSWRAGTAPGTLWLVGRPAAGKSVLASHVIDQLKPPQSYCSYFICRNAKTGDSNLSDCFRSIAFQMAMHDGLVREALLQLARDDLVWDKTDDAGVWRRLFSGCIFKLPSIGRHFWVIDAVDECGNFNSLFTKRLLATLPKNLRLFATSRNLDEIERGLASLGPSRANIQVLQEADTLEDMRLCLTTRLTELGRPEMAEDRERMCQKILNKSSGSFLWIRLVLQEFEDAWTEEAMDAVLRETPVDLFEFYSKMVESIEADRRKMTLAKSILTWVVLARRPLTVDELRCAVKLDINQTLQNVAKAIPGLCGQLIFVDQYDKVHLIHETAREFLLADDFGLELCIDKKHGHTRLASLLLGHLSTMKPAQAKAQQGSGRPRGFAKPAAAVPQVDTSLLDYACSFFSEHLYRATSVDDDLMDSLCDFLGASSVLSWIEHVAKSSDLASLGRAAINLREYLGRRMKYVPPTDPSVQLVDGWVTDLIRVAAKFRDQLLACPSSIHCLIPPLCPSDSVIAKTFGRDARPSSVSSGLVVKGLPTGSWDDCLIRMDFQKGQTTVVCHGDRFFAIGLSTGQISLYDPTSLQWLRQMKHPGRVRILEFGPDSSLLASCGAKHIVVWEPKSGTTIHTFPLRSPPLAVTFLGLDELLGAFQSNELTKWCLETGEHEAISWTENGVDAEDILPRQPPMRAAFLTIGDEVLLALGYRARPILIWNALELQLLGICGADIENNGIDCMAFNPDPEIPALVAAYQDGCLCVFDYTTMELQVERFNVYAHSVACSPDGRSVVIGCNDGAIEVFEIEQAHNGTSIILTLIYRTNHPLDGMIQGVAFSTDGLRFVDVRSQQGRVWAPVALVRKITGELESSIGTSEADAALLFPPRPPGMFDNLDDPEITSPLVASADGRFVVAGTSNGDVVIFATADARRVGVLYQHGRGTSIVSIAIAESRNLVISADDAGRVKVAELDAPLAKVGVTPTLRIAQVVLDRSFGAAIMSVLVNSSGDRVLVSGRHTDDQLWEIPSGAILFAGGHPESECSQGFDKPLRTAFQHPVNQDWVVLVTGDIARIYSWDSFVELTPPTGIRLTRESVPPQLSPAASTSYFVGLGFVIELLRPSPSSSSHVTLWPAAALDPFSSEHLATPAFEPDLDAVSHAVLTILGTVGSSTVVFLDVSLWVCSVDLQSVATTPAPTSIPLQHPAAKATFRTSSPFSASTSALASSRRFSTRSAPPTGEPAAHARRHFFALSEWRALFGDMHCVLAAAPTPLGRSGNGSRGAVAFAFGNRLVVVHGGLLFSESVAISSKKAHLGIGKELASGLTAGQYMWDVVSGSMHRRSSNW